MQGEPARKESGLGEGWKIEVDEEVDSKKKLDEQRKRLQKQLPEIEKFTDMDQMFLEGQKENGKGDLQETEQKRSELLPEHQRVQNRSHKDACACDAEMGKMTNEINEREARFLELAQKSSNCRMAGDDLEEKIRDLQAGEERRGSCASHSNGCCFDCVLEQLFTWGAAHARQQIQALQEESNRRFEVPATPVHMAGREERGEEVGEEQAQRAAIPHVALPAPGGRNEGFLAGSVFDPARYQDANGESGGGGDFNSPRNGPKIRKGSRTPTQTAATDARG